MVPGVWLLIGKCYTQSQSRCARLNDGTAHFLTCVPSGRCKLEMQKGWQLLDKAQLRLVKGPCILCGGMGFTHADVQPGHALFGKALPCACTLARRKALRADALQQESGLLGMNRFEKATFENFNQELPGVSAAYFSAIEFAAHPLGWLALVGPCGCGKTHLATAIARKRLEAGDVVLIETTPD